MFSLSYSALAAVVLYSLYKFFVLVHDRRQSARLGCLPGYRQKNRLPFGIDQLRRFYKADKERRVPDEYVDMFEEEGRHTFQTSMLGMVFVQTSEPKNIQAMLAKQFRDFELGELRRKTFFPLLGNGIFTDDGKAW